MSQTVERMLPLYEGKMIHQFDHRWATYDPGAEKGRDVTLAEKQDVAFAALPRYWVREEVVRDRLTGKWEEDWLLGWRDICRSSDVRTMIATINGGGASPEGGTLLAFPDPPDPGPALLAVWNSYVFDFVARQKVGGTHLKYFTMRQLAMPGPELLQERSPWSDSSTQESWLIERALLLILDSDEMASVARAFEVGLSAHAWNTHVRETARAEIDAACFHLFGIERDDVDYIMETFPIVRQGDLAEHRSYRTKDQILAVYDQMQRAIDTGEPYLSPLQGLFDEMRLADD